MITGFNTNVRYRGRVFHVQTEDSGRKNPHVISHVYHGGTILASEKRKYDHLLDTADIDSSVRRLMEEQHKSMLRRLKDGGFDEVIAQRLDGGAAVSPDANAATGSGLEPPSESTAPEKGQPADAAAAAASSSREFGDGIVSKKPLDEVILEYLVEKARDRAPAAAPKPARGSRPRE
jgi:hypothetical protein